MNGPVTLANATNVSALALDYAIESEKPGTSRIAPGATLEECVRFCENFVAAQFMGSFSYLGAGSWVANTDRIGRYCSIGQGVLIGAGPHPVDWLSTSTFFYRRAMWTSHPTVEQFYENHPVDPQFEQSPCRIGNDVWIGSHAVIMMGVNVGDGAVIGANATVTKDVPPYAIVAGSPAKVIRTRFSAETIERLLASQWWNLHPSQLKGLNYSDIEQCLATLANANLAENTYQPRRLRAEEWIVL
ncbi:CatB-related O-acetyltransferase [Methylobacterium nonmethylotrophicum]|nr:CatB-related O-acetyltransferase [Methylobacterium nonmethylotrophicum]